jgi:hypothetical protein
MASAAFIAVQGTTLPGDSSSTMMKNPTAVMGLDTVSRFLFETPGDAVAQK